MSESIIRSLQLTLSWLPLLTVVAALFGIALAIRGTLLARKEAYARKHQDFLDLKGRVQKGLRED